MRRFGPRRHFGPRHFGRHRFGPRRFGHRGPRFRVPHLGVRAQAVGIDFYDARPAWTQEHHLENWHLLSHSQRLAFMRKIAMQRGMDPRLAALTVKILKQARTKPREYEKQAAAILRWVQFNIFYVNEPGERLADPITTLKLGYGDCDDACLLLGALFTSINFPWRFVLCGKDPQTGGRIRYVEGDPESRPDVKWAHVYLMVGLPPFRPSVWYYCEPTVRGVPLGWDVISGDKRFLKDIPELSVRKGPPVVAELLASGRYGAPSPVGAPPLGSPPLGDFSRMAVLSMPSANQLGGGAYGTFVPSSSSNPVSALAPTPSTLVPATGMSPAVVEAASTAGGITAAASLDLTSTFDWKRIGTAVITGVAVSVLTALTLDFINVRGRFTREGSR